MDRDKALAFEHAKLAAQEVADDEGSPIGVIEVDGTFRIIRALELASKDAILYTAYPTIYERLTPNSGISYNRNEVKLTTIRHLIDDDGKETEMELTAERWGVEYARKVQAFLNKVLGSEEKQ